MAVAAADDIVDIRSCIILHGEVAAVIAQAADLCQKRAHIVLAVSFAADRHGHDISDWRISDGDVTDCITGNRCSPTLTVKINIFFIWVNHATQIRHFRNPDIFGVLGRTAIGSKEERLTQFALIAHKLPRRLVHGAVTVGTGFDRAQINLTGRRRRDVKAIRRYAVHMRGGICTRADRLRLERLDRPTAAHLIRHNALNIRLQIHKVHKCELLRLLRIEAGKLEITIVRA